MRASVGVAPQPFEIIILRQIGRVAVLLDMLPVKEQILIGARVRRVGSRLGRLGRLSMRSGSGV